MVTARRKARRKSAAAIRRARSELINLQRGGEPSSERGKHMLQLIRYEAACRAPAEATRVDEVKDICDKATAMQAYAAQAQDTQLIGYATEIRFRAERRGGELLIELRLNGGRDPGGHGKRIESQAATQLPKLEDLGVTKTQSSRWQRPAKLPDERFQEKLQRHKAQAENSTTSVRRYPKAESTGNEERYTPKPYIDLARELFGDKIDVDPASSDLAQQTVQAATYFTKDNDGLKQEWRGRVWMNPPYTQGLIDKFIDKLVEELKSGHVTEAIVLTNNSGDTEWWQVAAEHFAVFCQKKGRIPFDDPDGKDPKPHQGQTFFYFSNDIAKFKAVFKTVGVVAAPLR
jgi:hypothetical protein